MRHPAQGMRSNHASSDDSAYGTRRQGGGGLTLVVQGAGTACRWAIAWNVSHETDWGAQARRAKAELVGVVEGETTARRGEEKA